MTLNDETCIVSLLSDKYESPPDLYWNNKMEDENEKIFTPAEFNDELKKIKKHVKDDVFKDFSADLDEYSGTTYLASKIEKVTLHVVEVSDLSKDNYKIKMSKPTKSIKSGTFEKKTFQPLVGKLDGSDIDYITIKDKSYFDVELSIIVQVGSKNKFLFVEDNENFKSASKFYDKYIKEGGTAFEEHIYQHIKNKYTADNNPEKGKNDMDDFKKDHKDNFIPFDFELSKHRYDKIFIQSKNKENEISSVQPLDFIKHIYDNEELKKKFGYEKKKELYKSSTTFGISDHLPVIADLKIHF